MVLNRLSPICIRFRNSFVGSREVKSRFSSRKNSYSCLNYKQLKYKLITDCKVSLKWTLVLYKNFELPKCPSICIELRVNFVTFEAKENGKLKRDCLYDLRDSQSVNPVYTITFWVRHGQYFGTGAACFRHGASNSDSRDFKIYDAAFKTK